MYLRRIRGNLTSDGPSRWVSDGLLQLLTCKAKCYEMSDRASDYFRVGQPPYGSSQMSSIKTDELMNSIHNTFHYADMTGGKTFISSERNGKWDCVSLPNASETLFFSNSPITRNHKLTNRPNGLARRCRHERRYFWKWDEFTADSRPEVHVFIKWRPWLNL